MTYLMSDLEVIDRIFDHVDNKTTDLGDITWKEPVENYISEERFQQELEVLRRTPVAFCPSAALPEAGSYIARKAAGRPIIVVRGDDGVVRAFKNACRHRGMPVASEGEGCSRAFVCPYHAWTYGLDGKLKHIPGSDGFPGVDKGDHGLIEVTAVEKGGLVFVTQDDPISDGALEAMPEMLSPEQEYFGCVEFVDKSNWKLIAETSMEGYHIKSLHNKSFYPYGMDNVNVVEPFGPNFRITFPFRRIEKLRDIPREERRISGMVTYVNQLFPNTHLSVLSNHTMMIVLEPISPSETHWYFYRMTNKPGEGPKKSLEEIKKDVEFVRDVGLVEDRDAAIAIQDSLATGANTHFTFGQNESGIIHFHKYLDDAISKL